MALADCKPISLNYADQHRHKLIGLSLFPELGPFLLGKRGRPGAVAAGQHVKSSSVQRHRRYAVHLIAVRGMRIDCLPAQSALQWRMPELTRSGDHR
jgi:hypothetical protein